MGVASTKSVAIITFVNAQSSNMYSRAFHPAPTHAVRLRDRMISANIVIAIAKTARPAGRPSHLSAKEHGVTLHAQICMLTFVLDFTRTTLC